MTKTEAYFLRRNVCILLRRVAIVTPVLRQRGQTTGELRGPRLSPGEEPGGSRQVVFHAAVFEACIECHLLTCALQNQSSDSREVLLRCSTEKFPLTYAMKKKSKCLKVSDG